MSILQEYEDHYRYMGRKRLHAIQLYLRVQEKIGRNISYTDVVYGKNEWRKFDEWFRLQYNQSNGRSVKSDKGI